MKTKILADFQICISFPLSAVLQLKYATNYALKTIKHGQIETRQMFLLTLESPVSSFSKI